jgi:dipeptide/tripeptide permease
MIRRLRRTLDVQLQAQRHGFRTAPEATSRLPSGIGYIVANEAAERFSFYGMRAILIVFMCEHLTDDRGNSDIMVNAEAREWYILQRLTPSFPAP